MTRAYGRAPKSERVLDSAPKNWGQNYTLIAGLCERGMIAPMLLTGSLTGDAFVGYMRELVAPELRAGDVVVLDNLAAHKLAEARELIEARGAQLLFLPPYSPELNPIEMAWSKLKAVLRKLRPRTLDALVDAFADALRSVTDTERAAWIRHSLRQYQCI